MLSAMRAATRHAGEALDITRRCCGTPGCPSRGRRWPRRCRRPSGSLLPLRMPDLLRVLERYGGTINDVLLAVAGALRRWLSTRGHPVDDLSLRALSPVNHRPRSRGQIGDQLSGYLCDLPVAQAGSGGTVAGRQGRGGPEHGRGAAPRFCGVSGACQPPAATDAPDGHTGTGRRASLLFDTVVTNVPLPRRAGVAGRRPVAGALPARATGRGPRGVGRTVGMAHGRGDRAGQRLRSTAG